MCVFREREACDLHLCYSVCVCSSVSHCKCVYLTELLCSFFFGGEAVSLRFVFGTGQGEQYYHQTEIHIVLI